jgi:hypothetical protein
MPMPTPPGPGEEPTTEAELYRYHFRRLITWYLEAINPLPPDAFTWTPPKSEMNSLAAICSHAISSSEWWTLSCVGDAPLERDRDAEFTASVPPWSAMREQASRRRPHEPPLPDACHRASGLASRPCRANHRLVESGPRRR